MIRMARVPIIKIAKVLMIRMARVPIIKMAKVPMIMNDKGSND